MTKPLSFQFKLLLVAAAALILFFVFSMYSVKAPTTSTQQQQQQQQSQPVADFSSCSAAGYPVTGTYPRSCTAPSGSFMEPVTTAAGKTDMVVIEQPSMNQKVSNPITIKGRARGTWYFEASFPIRLVDAEGKVLGKTIAQAQGDWMTEDYVPFTATLAFTAPIGTDSGQLIFQKDNPSGLAQNEDELRMPVYISTTDAATVKVYFGKYGPSEVDCGQVFAVERTVPMTQAIARAAIDQLLIGVTVKDKANGYFTSLNADVKVQKLTITDGTATVDFSKSLDQDVGGACRVTAIRAQITQTLLQFPTVKHVVISIDGKTQDILQP